MCSFRDLTRNMHLGSVSLYEGGGLGKDVALGVYWAWPERTLLLIKEFVIQWKAMENDLCFKYRSRRAGSVFLDNSEAEFRLLLRQGHRQNSKDRR